VYCANPTTDLETQRSSGSALLHHPIFSRTHMFAIHFPN
jgi:hypothetical protein